MPFWIKYLAVLLLCLGASGCRTYRSNWLHPGSEKYQRQQAVLFDPYADNDLGPEVVGVRPREYDKPLSEPQRAQLFRESWWGR